MKKLKMNAAAALTFEEGCNKYLLYCRQRNLREGTINHYRQSYTQFYKYFDPQMPVTQITKDVYNDYVLYLRETLDNDVSINSYLRDLITTLHFLMNEGYIPHFKMQAIKADKNHIETYTEEELQLLLKKPNMKKCSFTEYQCWVMTNFLFSTGVRQRSLMHIRVKDVDFDNNVVYVNVTKNRKPLIVPLNSTMVNILMEYLKHRHHKAGEDYLFCNVFGQQLVKSTCYHIVKTESDKMLLLAEKPIAQKPYTDEVKKVTWETSALRAWLNGEFMDSFSVAQQSQILLTDTGDTEEKVFLLSVDEIDELSKSVKFKTTDEWWTRTSIENSIVYMSSTGWVKADGDHVVRDKGVRPSIWISLK